MKTTLLSCLLVSFCFLNVIAQPPNHPPQPQCNVNLGPDKTICSGKSVTLDAGPGNRTYLWSDGSTTKNITVNTSGTYWVAVTGNNGCTDSDTVVVTVDSNALHIDSHDEFLTCAEPCHELHAHISNGTPPYSILWSNGATTDKINVCDTVTTAYIITASDSFGCTNTDTATVTYSDSLCGVDKILICHPGPHGSRTQCIKFADLNLHLGHGATIGCCSGSVQLPCQVNLGPDRKICPGGSVTIDAGAGWSSYLWSSGDTTQTITASQPGTGWVAVTDSSGCTASDTITVSMDTTFKAKLGKDKYINCGATCVRLDAKGEHGAPPFNYAWSNGDSVKKILVCDTISATYSVTITDGRGCVGEDTVNVIISDSLCGDGKVLVCHNDGRRSRTLCVPVQALQAHLDAGDVLGCCDSVSHPHPHHPPHHHGHGHHMAHPNPFHNKTTIEYSFDEPDYVTVEVYNSTGMRVSNLYSGNVEAGKIYSIDFVPGNLPPGIYFYKITAQSGDVYYNKMFLLK